MLFLRSIFMRVLLVAAAAATHAVAAPSLLSPTPPATTTAAAASGIVVLGHRQAKADATTVAAATTITRTAALPSTATAYASMPLFTSAILNSTNTYRRQHNASAVTWNATLAHFADAYLANDTACTFAHSGGPYGENIAIGYATPRAAVEAWGNERGVYDFTHPDFHEATGHFTQLVWKSTTTVGCARVFCGGAAASQENTGWFVACEYWPRGNVLGHFGEEVDRQSSGPGFDPGSASGAGHGTRLPTVSGAVIAAAAILFASLAAAVCRDIMDAVAE